MYENYNNGGNGVSNDRHSTGLVNTPLVYGCETYEIINPKYAKIVYKINSSGNLTIECTPSYTPGTLPNGVVNGVIPSGMKIFNYDKKIIYSITFDDCINIIEMANSFNPTNGTVPNTFHLFRNSAKFNKKMGISYLKSVSNDNYYVLMNFESTDVNKNVTKFDLPMNIQKFNLFVKVIESYINSYHMIKYYNQIEMAKDNKLNAIIANMK